MTARHPRRVRAAIAASLAAVALAGCATTVDGTGSRAGAGPAGGSGSSAAAGGSRITDPVELLAAMEADTNAAMAGNGLVLLVDARLQDDVVSQLQVTLQGDDGRGTFTVGGEPCELVRVGDDVYAKAGAAFWTTWAKLPAATATAIDDTWVTATGRAASLAIGLDGPRWIEQLSSIKDPYAGDLATRESREAIEVNNDAGYRLLVFTQSPHRLVEAFSPGVQYSYVFLDDPASAVTAPEGAKAFPV